MPQSAHITRRRDARVRWEPGYRAATGPGS